MPLSINPTSRIDLHNYLCSGVCYNMHMYTLEDDRMKTVTLTVRIPSEIKDRLEALSKATDRTQAFLAGQAIQEFIETQEWQIRAIEQGIKAAEQDEFASDDQVHQAFSKWGVHTDH